MQKFESWEDVKAHYGSLTPAEEKLKVAVAKGKICVLADGERPSDPKDWRNPAPNRHIRANVLRFLMTCNVENKSVTEYGIVVQGALITDLLNLMDCEIQGNAGFTHCYFGQTLYATRAKFKKNFHIKNSHLPNLLAMGATIHGQLDCSKTFFSSERRNAINLESASINHSVFLRGIVAHSEVNLGRAKIGGQLACEEASFLVKGTDALYLGDITIGSGFYFRKITQFSGRLNLMDAHATTLVDDAGSWAKVDDLILDGFHYDRIAGNTKPTFAERMDWLEKGSVFQEEFFPQPYTQLADTYKSAGHDREARDVRVALAKKLNDHIRKDLILPPNGDISVGFKSAACDIWIGTLWCWHKLQLLLTGHGFKPQRAIYALILLVAACWGITNQAWKAGDFAPNSDVILLSEDWGRYAVAPNHAKAWEESQAGKDWESFSPVAYAADIVIPIVDFGQTQAWAPSTNRGPWGYHLWWARWVFTAAGWIISALGAAAITGVIRRE